MATILRALAVASLAAAAGTVGAATITGSASGSFSSPTCTGHQCGSTGGGASIWWGENASPTHSQNSTLGFTNPQNFSGDPLSDVQVGLLTWTNATIGTPGSDWNTQFGITLQFTFTAPSAGSGGAGVTTYYVLNDYAVQGTSKDSEASDEMTLASLPTSLSVAAAGGTFLIDDFRYEKVGTATDHTLSSLLWAMNEGASGSLRITADITYRPEGNGQVPLPGTLALIGASLLGMAFARRKS